MTDAIGVTTDRCDRCHGRTVIVLRGDGRVGFRVVHRDRCPLAPTPPPRRRWWQR